ncbi:uncharacterized protein LOC132751872 [Ruditapes philippinarum]|uniref:uncharacterized protein LOC132751872 n=1 Tax=Ruditapes philippinarum TaxID=129788 RepID=UPI00295B5B47|nr:uncharacterized protein LOC132751872 [Ruditapes philippinarum]
MHTVFCIDTSCSMKLNNALIDARTFVYDYISALMDDFERKSRCYFTSLVTFGEETKLLQQWTKDVNTLLESIENLPLSGHGDLATGLEYSKNAALSPCNYVTTTNNTLLREIIVITDGRATDFDAKRKHNGNKREVKQLC